MKERSKNILFVYQGQRSFFDCDIKILKEIATVQTLDNFPPTLKKAFTVIRGVWKNDLIYIWFMGRHAVLPLLAAKILGKKVVLVAGGWDVANCPEIDYGLMRPGIKSFVFKRLFKLPDLIFSISRSNHRELLMNAGVPESKTKMAYLGFEDLEIRANQKKERMVVTIGEVNQSNLQRKGLKLFVEVAKQFPDVSFVMIGRWAIDGAIDDLKRNASKNVKFTGFLSREEMNQYLDRAAIYAQFSYHEAFGCAVAEAMLHECVPVVTNQYALPEVVGDAGVIASQNLEDIIKGILRALEIPTGLKPHERIKEVFPFSKRQVELQTAVESVG